MLMTYVSVKNSSIGIGAVCPLMARTFSLGVSGTEWFRWMYFYMTKVSKKDFNFETHSATLLTINCLGTLGQPWMIGISGILPMLLIEK